MPNYELMDLRDELRRLGAALGLSVREDETTVKFARRCRDTARKLRMGAGVTWADYELVAAQKGVATFALRQPVGDGLSGGPRWRMQVNEPLDTLAEKLGLFEEASTS